MSDSSERTLHEGMAANPSQRLADLPLLTKAQRHQLLVEWNHTTADYPKDLCIHQLFEQQVEQTPDAVAVVFGNEQLTYRELNCQANQLAHHLQAQGVGPDVLVGIYVERSLEMVVGVLGILKAGGAYVPLDPNYPSERLAFMLEDAQAPVLLTQQRLVAQLPQQVAKIVCLDAEWETIAQLSRENSVKQVIPDNIAYLIYTSGSTGKPKGVAIEHNSTVVLLNWAKEVFMPEDLVGVLAATSLCFDLSVFELFVPLSWGGTVILAENVLHLPNLSAAQNVTLLNTVPSAIHELLQINGIPASVRTVNLAGEPLQNALVQKLYQLNHIQQVFNLYGPSEDTTYSTFALVKRDALGIPTIGRPITNTQVYILNSQLQPVPVGVLGELYIGGEGLARGYLNRPELTAERFIPHPFSNQPGTRLYKTGDLARYLPDAKIEFLGRIDQQVKLRGFRIELGEIEAVLSQHPAVRQNVVILREDVPGDQRLVVYCVPQQQAPTVNDLRQFLQEKLPEYMMPSAFVLLESLPLTPNGKVDRRALPSPDPTRRELEETFVAARTPIEEVLAGIWTEVLRVEQVGVDDNFFELGGHSLLATQVISRLRTTLAVELPLRSLFEHPIVARLAEKIENLLRLGQSLQAPPLLSIARSAEMPLSFAQQRLWFLNQLEPDSAFYNIPDAVRLFGQLNITALEQSLNEIIRRHEALRTNFITVEGQPVTVIASTQKLALPIVDLQDLPETERLIETQRLATTEAQRPFDLATEPLVRATLLKLQAKEHVLLLTMHHIVSDGWSMGVLFSELAALYEAFCSGHPSPLAELPIQYIDFAVWQRQWLQAEVVESQLSYWKQQLNGAPALLELPTDRPRPTVQTFRGAHHSIALSQQISLALTNLSRRLGVTLFMTLLAGFQTLLYRYTQQEDIVVGSPIANRNHSSCEGLIGFFVNSLVLRTDLGGNPTFRELLTQVREVTLAAYAHQDLPFEQLVEELQPARSLSYTPLFQVIFALQNAAVMPSVELSGLSVTPLAVETGTAKFDLTVSMENTAQGLIGVLEYNTDLFDAATIARMAGHFQTLLEGIVANPSQRLADLPLLTKAQRHQLLVEWNHTTVDYPKDLCIHQLFEQQVEQTPDAVAVVFEQQQLTYRELNSRANQLAHYLQALGVGPDVLVGLCVERSLEMVVGVLGILKAGGAYVPLDPTYPFERLAFMLQDTQVSVLLILARFINSLPQHQAHVVCLDTDLEVIAQHSQENPVNHVTPDHLAYVMYTSGSTGQPKGVTVIHRSVVRLVKCCNYANLSAEEVFLQLAPISFDAATFEIWGSLLWGARLVVMPAHTPSLHELAQAIQQYQVTTLWLTAGLFHLMVDERLKDLKPVRQLLVGGDVLSVPHVNKVVQQLPGLKLINGYGPTENTTFTCCYSIIQSTEVGSSIPIGRPIANTQIYLLDSDLEPVPVGVSGELYIGGEGLARGYLNRPELTAERFIPHPFSNQPGTRLYKTGDLARYLPDAKIEFLGRIDQQVKLRGFRIELGEIEAVLSQHPAVRQNVVILREDVPGDQRLVVYCVPQQQAPTVNDLRQFLQEKLPEYMMPSAFVLLESLPLTPNGKVDRRALPSPDPTRRELEETFVAARTPVEEVLAGIWTEVLRVEQVGVDDNFFELGGHSLLATQVISRLRTTLAVELPLRSLFEHPTVARLAEKIENLLRLGQSLQAPPLLSIARSAEMPLSFAQQRLWFLNQLEPDSAFYNIPDAVRLFGQLNITALEQSLNEIIRRHEALRTNFITVEGQPVTVIASTQKLALPIVDLQDLPETERLIETQRLATTEAQRPFDLATEPLVRATLLKLQAKEHVLLLTMHHIISDGWSMGVLFSELAALYEAFCSGHPSPLAELPIQYIDFAVWQRQWLQAEVVESQLSYWKQQLNGAPALLELPTDRPRPTVQTFRGAHHSIALSQQISLALTNLSRRLGVTLFMTLLAGFQTLLYRYTQQEDIVVGSPIANRNHSSCEGLIGFFVNSLVLRTDLGGNPTFRELLTRVREVTLAAYAHQDLPFEQLVEELQPARSLSYTPLFQVIFALQNAAVMPSVELSGLSVTPLAVETGTAKFDLTVSMENTAQGLIGVLEYNTDLFDAATIARMAGHFQTLLEGIVANPSQRLADLPLLTKAQRHQLLVEWNHTTVDYPKDLCIHQLFEQQVEQTPDVVAVVFEQQQLTYRELNSRANQLAHYLQALGVGPDVLVGLCVERSLEMVVGVLGILKAGGAYVPLDPTYPFERLAFMLQDTQATVLLTQKRLVAGLPQQVAKVIYLDTDWEFIEQESLETPIGKVKAKNLAYVIYTSGSTGLPKGVMNTHQAVSNRLHWMQNTYQLTAADRVLQKTPFSFDVSVWEFFWPLLSGVRLVLARPGGHQDSTYLVQLIAEMEITTLHFVPSMLQLFLEEPRLEACQCLKRVICSGEALPCQLQEHFFARLDAELYNLYGPTEAAIDVTFWSCVRESHMRTVPIGRPIANTQIYILDSQMQPVPIGVPGELHIGGVGLACGYLNRPELTADKFIPNPFSHKSGARLYKTGDLAHYLPDGNIEFLGRIDHQVKLRGFRIELGEIEAVLSQHPAVRQTVVIVREDVSGDQRLVAYLVLHQETAPIINDLRRFLKQQLPEYMVPSAFVFLETLPLTSNGKVDRRALPSPDQTSLEMEETFVAPRTPLEEVLAVIWATVLRLERVGIHNNFFEIGGHSLLATQVISRVREAFYVELPLRNIFETPTIAGLAASMLQDPSSRLKVEKTAQLLLRLAQLSDDKVRKMLDEKTFPLKGVS